MKQSSENTEPQTQPAQPMAEVKRVMILSHWLAALGNRRSAAKALGLGYTNVVESLREYGVSNRLPNPQQKQQVLQGLTDLRISIDRLEAEVNLCECESDTK